MTGYGFLFSATADMIAAQQARAEVPRGDDAGLELAQLVGGPDEE